MLARVLVADDSPTIRRRAQATLSEAGYEVTCVEDGDAAWKALEAAPGFQALLCDILMPGIDGYDLCRRVKGDDRFARLPVLLLRGTFEPWDQARAVDAGADGFVTKPFDSEALLETMREVLSEPTAPAAPAEAEVAAPGPFDDASPLAEPEHGPSTMKMAAMSLDDIRSLVSGRPVTAASVPEVSPLGDSPLGVAADAPLGLGVEAPLGAGSQPLPDESVFGGPLGDLGAPPAPLSMVPADDDILSAEPLGPLDADAGSGPEAPPPVGGPLPDELVTRRPAAAAPAPLMAAFASATAGLPAGPLDAATIERIADLVAARLTTRELERVAWEVVPDVAEALIRKRLLEIEAQLGDG